MSGYFQMSHLKRETNLTTHEKLLGWGLPVESFVFWTLICRDRASVSLTFLLSRQPISRLLINSTPRRSDNSSWLKTPRLGKFNLTTDNGGQRSQHTRVLVPGIMMPTTTRTAAAKSECAKYSLASFCISRGRESHNGSREDGFATCTASTRTLQAFCPAIAIGNTVITCSDLLLCKEREKMGCGV